MKIQRFPAAIACALFLALAGAATAAPEKVYKWTDEKGVVHYGQQPPSEAKAEAISVRKGYTAPEADAAPPTEAERKAAEEAEFCRVATHNFQALSGDGDVKRRDEYGVERILTPEEKAAERDRAQKAMDAYCKQESPPAP